MKSKTIKILIAIVILSMIAVFAFATGDDDPNGDIKDNAQTLQIGTAATVNYEYAYDENAEDVSTDNTSFIYAFQPAENGTYAFRVTGIDSANGIAVSSFLMDGDMGDIMSITNVTEAGDDEFPTCSGSASGSAYLLGGQVYYLTVNVDNVNDVDAFSGSFEMSAEMEYGGEPESVSTEQAAVVRAVDDQQSCVVFRPEEDGYYRIDCGIANATEDENGSSVISSVVRSDGLEVEIAEGVCHLEAGQEYYIWVTAYDLSGEQAEVSVTCNKLETESASGTGDIEVGSDTNIQYTADSTGQMLVYSISEGDPRATVYDSDGFPVGSDDNADGAFSSNAKDFALVFSAEEGKSYKICVEGDPCQVKIEPYTGDGEPFIEYDEPDDPVDPDDPIIDPTDPTDPTDPEKPTVKPVVKKANTLTAKGKTLKIKYKVIKKKKKTYKASKAFTVKNNKGKVTYKVLKYPKKAKKKIVVSKSGKVTVKKGLKKGTYKVKVKVTAAGNTYYKAGSKTVTLIIKIK